MLHNVSTWFEAGKAYAIVGGSGSGKSTLLNLLTAANIEYSGSITLDGIEIRDIAPESLYDIISVIQQNVFVFNASIKDNVSMFRLFDNAELDDAIRRAHLGELIAERGENYLCGENGSALSGGERQRISIARAILKDAPVVILDEATASMDAENETLVQQALSELLQGKTVLVIAHRMRTIANADKVVVLDHGQVVEMGTPTELLEENGLFQRLVAAQGGHL